MIISITNMFNGQMSTLAFGYQIFCAKTVMSRLRLPYSSFLGVSANEVRQPVPGWWTVKMGLMRKTSSLEYISHEFSLFQQLHENGTL